MSSHQSQPGEWELSHRTPEPRPHIHGGRSRARHASSQFAVDNDLIIGSDNYTAFLDYRCRSICPTFGHGNLHCSWETHHALEFEGWNGTMMWGVAYLAIALLIGALGSVMLRNFAPAVPYTVGLLLFGILLGFVAHMLAAQDFCPTHALDPIFDRDHSGSINRDEWEYFTCHNCNPDSVCATPGSLRSCLRDRGCPTFDELDAPFSYTAMDPADAVRAQPSDHLLCPRRQVLF